MTFDEILKSLGHPRRATKDVYRLGDTDFDAKRDRFYENCRIAFGEPQPIVLPLVAYYGFEPETMKARAQFYADCARVFGFEGWKLDPPAYKCATGNPGRDGDTAEVEKYGHDAIHSYRNYHAGTVEMFERKSELLDSIMVPPYSDEKRDQAAFEGNTRRRVARMVRDLFDGEMVSAMKSADLEAVPGGTFGGKVASDHALDCQAKVSRLRQEIPPMCMATLELVLRNEQFIWERKDRRDAKTVLQEIRLALDFAAWSLGTEVKGRQEITKYELCQRWEVAGEWFWQQKLRPAMHLGRVVKRQTR